MDTVVIYKANVDSVQKILRLLRKEGFHPAAVEIQPGPCQVRAELIRHHNRHHVDTFAVESHVQKGTTGPAVAIRLQTDENVLALIHLV